MSSKHPPRRRRPRLPASALGLLGLFCCPASAWGQAAEKPFDGPENEAGHANASLAARMAQQDAKIAALQQQIAQTPEEAPGSARLLSFWGFSDLSFGVIHFDNNNALYKVQAPSHSTFFSSGINLYAKSEMTRTLSALVETRLTYTPTGYASDWPTEVNFGSTTVQTLNGLSIVDTSTRGPYSQLQYRQDGILIERAYLEWTPADWFGVRVGRFLTPFGIWNEDHGSPVLIGVDYPQFMNFNIVPIWQLGAEMFGRVGLGDDARLEYALTIANSRGPEDEYKDLTDMKAFGARLKFVYNPEPFLFRLGGYAYYSHYRDSITHIRIQVGSNLALDPAYNPSFGSYSVDTQSYDETVLTGDAELRYRHLRIIGEFARQTIIYNLANQISDDEKLLKGVPFSQAIYDPSHYGLGGYVMAAYEIPIHTAAVDLSVMPYAGYDYVVPSTTVQTRNNIQIRAGLNVKPSPYVTLKLEVSRLLPESHYVASNATGLMSQVAFSF
jgi:hypothetical protein